MSVSSWNKLQPLQKIQAVHVDIMNSPIFATMGGVVCVGKFDLDEEIGTAGTDGCDVSYAPSFINEMPREELRYLVLHENFHKALHHCTEYHEVSTKYPKLTNKAMDYVVNGFIEEMDSEFKFVQRPTKIPPLVDPRFKDKSFIDVLRQLLREEEEPEDDGNGNGNGGFDIHKRGVGSAEIAKQLADAVKQGEIMAKKLRGSGSVNTNLSNTMQKRSTNWREHLRNFFVQICEGDDYSRFSPPNKLLQPHGILMPSHYSESTGEVVIACDTSGSMGGVYPTVFGEISRICLTATPKSVRIIWWEDTVAGEQVFTEKDYAGLAKLLKPAGGGGTRVSCVHEYIVEKKLNPKAVVYLTDGYIESDYTMHDCPTLWGVVDNESFVPRKGKVVQINSQQ